MFLNSYNKYVLWENYFLFKNNWNKISNINYDKYNFLFLNLSGVMIWLNLIHINVMIIKKNYLILINNIEYLITKYLDFIFIKRFSFFGGNGEYF